MFLAEELAKSGTTMEDIAAKLKTGKSIAEIANEQHSDWKQIAQEAKKLNGAVDRNLYKYFLRQKDSAAQDVKDAYDVNYDGVKADADMSKYEPPRTGSCFGKTRLRKHKAKDATRHSVQAMNGLRIPIMLLTAARR